MTELLLTLFIYLYGTCDSIKVELEAHGIQSISDVYQPQEALLIGDVCKIH
jgi:hypothetical protein